MLQNDFKNKPFYLNDEDIKWVNETFANMSILDKIGQLFFLVSYRNDEEFFRHIACDLKVGGMMCRTMFKEDLIKSISSVQSKAKIPLFIAANLEAGGNGIVKEGTKIASQMGVAATNDVINAKLLGKVCAEEAKAVGANFAFAPVCDIDMNFRNPITNTRTFGSDKDMVLNYANNYMQEVQAHNMLTSIKHFPGDGVDERDQHLLTSINNLSCSKWDKTYGYVYKNLIKNGAKAVMVGHIMQPAYTKYFNPDIVDEDIMPATLSKELLQGLLRKKLGFKGLVLTDATTMTGFCQAMPRDKAVPLAIEYGCDMFLFTKNLDEDFKFMIDGLNNKLLSEERLNEAVMRILATKASIGLHKNNNIPTLENADKIIGKKEYKDIAYKIANESITLVKNKENIIPLDKDKIKNILVYEIESGENALGYDRAVGMTDKFIKLLEAEGFNVTKFTPGDRYEGKQSKFKDMVESYDLMIYVANLATKSNQTTVRIEWANPMGMNCPIYIHSVPTIFISLENPYHLLDVPRIKTYINTYFSNDYTLELLVAKLFGKSNFTGISPVDVFCGKWDTKL